MVAAAIAGSYVVRLWDPDPWWHLATGRFIVEHHALPAVDPFSFTMAGAPWRAVDWLADLVMYGSFWLGGDAGVGALTALSAFAMLALVGLTLRELEVSAATAAAIVVCVGVMVQGRYSMARPMMLGAVALCATLWLCTRTWQRAAARPHDRSILFAAPLVVVWTVVHSTAILGLFVLAIFAIAALLGRHAAARRYLMTVALATVACALLPSARERFAVALGLERSSLAVALTLEWAATRVGDRELWLPALGAITAAAVVARTAAGRRTALPYLGCTALGVAVAARFGRNLYEAILLAAPLAGLAVERGHRWLVARQLRVAPLMVVLVVALLVPALHLRLAPKAFNPHFGVGPDDGAVPTETLALLRRLPAGRVMNDCTSGGWLIWQRIPVYCDGRTVALYREADIRRLFLPLYGDARTIEGIADRFAIHYALARADSDFERTLMRSAAFVPLAYDREHALFIRRRFVATLPAEVLPLDELRFANDPQWLDWWYAAVAADAARGSRLEAEVARAVALCPTSRTLHAALVYLGRAQPALAGRLERRLTATAR